MCLYALLVVPREKLKGKYEQAFKDLNNKISSYATITKNTYTDYQGGTPCDFAFHLRNAVSHAKVSFEPGSTVEFKDKKGAEELEMVISLCQVGQLLKDIQCIHTQYYQDRMASAA